MDEKEKLQQQNNKLLEMLEEYKNEIQSKTALLEEYSSIGSPEEIKRTMAESIQLISDYRTFGDLEQVKTKLESLQQYESIGSIENILKGIAYLEAYTNLGTVEKFMKLTAESNIYEEFSNIEQISVFSELKKVIETLNSGVNESDEEITLEQKVNHAIKILEVASMHEASSDDLEKSIQAVIEFSNNGQYTIKHVKESMELLNHYKDYGSLSEMEETCKFLENLVDAGFTAESISMLSKYQEYGSLEDLKKVKETLERVVDLGSIDEIEKAVAYTKEQYRKVIENKKLELAKSFNLTEKAINTLFEQFDGNFEKMVEHIELFRPAAKNNINEGKIKLVSESVSETLLNKDDESSHQEIKKENLHNFLKLVK